MNKFLTNFKYIWFFFFGIFHSKTKYKKIIFLNIFFFHFSYYFPRTKHSFSVFGLAWTLGSICIMPSILASNFFTGSTKFLVEYSAFICWFLRLSFMDILFGWTIFQLVFYLSIGLRQKCRPKIKNKRPWKSMKKELWKSLT